VRILASFAVACVVACAPAHAVVSAAPRPKPFDLAAVAWSPAGDVLAAGDSRGRVFLWDGADGRPRGSFAAHRDRVTAIAFARDGGALVTTGADAAVRQWDLAGRPLAAWPGRRGTAALSGGWAALADRRSTVAFTPRIVLQRLEPDAPPRQLPGIVGEAIALASTSDGRLLASAAGSVDGVSIALWDAVDGSLRRSFRAGIGILALAFAPDGARIAGGGDHSDLRVWDAGTGRLLRRLLHDDEGAERVHAVAWAPDGRTLYAGGRFFGVRAFDPTTGASRRLVPPGLAIGEVAPSPGGSRLAVLRGRWGQALEVIDAETGRRLWSAVSG
jgi:hypothetical protein